VLQKRAALQNARRLLNEFVEAIPEIMVMEDMASPPQRYVLRRGAYDQPDEQRPVQPDVPAALLPFEPSWPRNRLGLSRWLCDPRHPLTARVAVNRLWATVFGRGLVSTLENFGMLGEVPAYPELLDTLSCQFVAGGWHVRALLRRFVLSATFRQSSAAPAALREQDPHNAWLARGPSFRLSAEQLRDQALAASGLLAADFGGPSVKPWQPPGLWADAGVGWAGADYTPDTGAAAHRRSLYTYRKRTAPPPDMLALDAGSREVCLAQRQATDTPLQPLVFWNDPVFGECAQALARRACDEAGAEPESRITRVFSLLTARAPRPAELAALRHLFDTQSTAFAADPAASAKVLGADGGPQQAALVLVAATLLAADAVVTCR
jgi:hypothetical protein